MVNIRNGYRISIMLTELCNLNCSHCYMHAGKKGKTLSFEQIDKIIDNLPANCKRISVTGGEPYMCRDKLTYILKKIRQKFPYKDTELRVETNGTFFYQTDKKIILEVNNLIKLGVNTLRLSDDVFHIDGGIDIEKLRNVEKVIRENNIDIVVSTLLQDSAVAFGRARNLKQKQLEPKNCLNKKESLIIPYFYTTIEGDVSTCAWKCAPILGNSLTDSWETIIDNLNTPIQIAILNSDILEVARIVSAGDKDKFEEYKSIMKKYGQCIACREMFKEKYRHE